MTNVSDLFRTEFSQKFQNTNAVHDPRLMIKTQIYDWRLYVSSDFAETNSNSSSFHTYVDTRGAYVSCATTADSYNTIVDISGSAGVCSGMYGPGPSSAGDITFRITVDGTVYTISVYSSGYDYRGFIGTYNLNHNYHVAYVPMLAEVWYTYDSDETNYSRASTNGYSKAFLLPAKYALTSHTSAGPCLGFLDSLKVEVKSENSIYNSSQYLKAGCVYTLI